MELGQGVGVGDVGREGDETVLGRIKVLRGLGELVGVKVGDGNLRSLRKEEFRGVPTDARVGTGDEGYPPIESEIHDVISCSRNQLMASERSSGGSASTLTASSVRPGRFQSRTPTGFPSLR